MRLDQVAFDMLNSLAGRSAAGDVLIRLLMTDYLVPTALALVLFGLWFTGSTLARREENQRSALFAITSMFIANLVVKACNLMFYRPRPFAFREVNLLFYYPSDSSFPSNAATVGFSVATAVWLANRRAGLLCYVLASAFALARVAGGVHYPADILGGLFIGAATAYVVSRKLPFIGYVFDKFIAQVRRLLLA